MDQKHSALAHSSRAPHEEDEVSSSFSGSCCDAFASGSSFFPTSGGATAGGGGLFCGPSNNPGNTQSGQHVRGNNSTHISDDDDGYKLLNKEFKKLSRPDREKVWEDIHGIASSGGLAIATAASATSDTASESDGNNSAANQTMDPHKKTPEEIKKKLEIMELEINVLPAERKAAFYEAKSINPKYANNTHLRMMMLRTASWNTREAARRLCKHFKVKLELFGNDKLARDIQFDDLPVDAQLSLRAGSFFCSHHCKDNTGRIIAVENYSKWQYKSIKSHVQAYWWGIMNCISRVSHEAHAKGVVTIAMTRNPASTPYTVTDLFSALFVKYDMESCVPIIGRCMHLCTENQPWVQRFHLMFLKVTPTFVTVRVRALFGSHTENMYELKTFGVVVERRPELYTIAAMESAQHDTYRLALPIGDDGEIHLGVVDNYIQYSQRNSYSLVDSSSNDASSAASPPPPPPPPPVQYNGTYNNKILAHNAHSSMNNGPMQIIPTRADILSGRGPTYREHPGNVFMTNLLIHYKATHNAASSRRDKTWITVEILRIVKAQGRRFLKISQKLATPQTNAAQWVELSDKEAQKKIATGFRNLTKKIKASTISAATYLSSASSASGDSSDEDTV